MSTPTLELSELDSRIGRVFISGIPGPRLDPVTQRLIRNHGLGGIILFSRNIENPLQLANLCRDLQECALNHQGIPLFLALDQEGGPVARLKEPFHTFPGNEEIGKDAFPQARVLEYAAITAREMRLVGLNMNLAPVVDVRRGKPERHLMGRTFGHDPEKVAALGATVVKELQGRGIMAVAKHFPGLGKADLDPHHRLPKIPVDRKELDSTDLPPFRAAIGAQVTGIMSSHALYPAVDPEYPATLSRAILTALLRQEMGFQGLIVTDDLEMGAISGRWKVWEGAVHSFEAGADVLLICEDQEAVLESMYALRRKLLRTEISPKRFRESERRVLGAKSRFLSGKERISLEKVKAYFT